MEIALQLSGAPLIASLYLAYSMLGLCLALRKLFSFSKHCWWQDDYDFLEDKTHDI